MLFPANRLHKSIALTVSALSATIRAENSFDCFESNKYAQEYFAGLLNLLGFKNLEDLDKKYGIPNYPAIDIAGLDDAGKKVAIQVTTDDSKNKFQGTIDRYIKNGFHKEYSRLIFIIIQEKEKRTPVINTKSLFSFSTGDDIWYTENLVAKIKELDAEQLSVVDSFLKKKLPDLTRILHNIPYEEFENALSYLTQILIPSGKIELNLNLEIPDRSPNFLSQKNVLNGIDENIFDKNIQKDFIYNYTLLDYISNGLGQEGIRKYFACCEMVNQKISNGENIIDVLKEIKNKISYSNEVKEDIMMILLHNMYCLCDIGINP